MMKLFTKITACWMLLVLMGFSPAYSQQFNRNTASDPLKKRERTPITVLRSKLNRTHTHIAPSVIPNGRTCGTVELEEKLQEMYPQRPNRAQFESILQRQIDVYQREDISREVITIPFIIHIIHNGESVGQGTNISSAQIQSQIDVLNEDFRRIGQGANMHPDGADMEIEFAPALVDPQGNLLSEPGVHRVDGQRAGWDISAIERTLKPQTNWDPNRYLNMWTVNFGGEDADLLGYAQFPSLSNLPGLDENEGPARTDGVVMGFQSFGRTGNVVAPYDGGRTTTHEIGHWLGLRHIWGDGDCSEDDFCADTPPASEPNYECIEISSCPNNGRDMVENYMDYSPDACMNVFTNDQKARMRAVMENSPRRKELLTSTVHTDNGSGAPVAAFSANNRVCVGDIINIIDESTNDPTSWIWRLFGADGSLLFTTFEQNPPITINASGFYSLELTVSNANGSSTKLETNFFTVLSSFNGNNLTNDFESTQNLVSNGWLISNPDADKTFELAGVSAFGAGDSSISFDNYDLDVDLRGTSDALISTRLDFSTNQNPYLTFDHAYAQYDNEFSDTLILMYSLDCGDSLVELTRIGGADLATAPATEDAFVPNANQWRTNAISLALLAGQSNVHIFIVNASGWGNNLYLDNIAFVDGNTLAQAPPEVDFVVNKTRICEGETLSFRDLSTNFPGQWFWGFEGGTPEVSSTQNPSVQYNTPGIYGVQLTAFNVLGAGVLERREYIEVIALPDVRVSVSQEVVCEGNTVRLTASGANSFLWFSEGEFLFAGDFYNVTLNESREFRVVGFNELGCEDEVSITINVVPTPDPTVEISAIQDTICEGSEVQLVASGADSYSWFSETNSSEPIFEGDTLILPLSESQQISVIGTTELGCSDEASIPISVIPGPMVEVNISQDTICVGDTVSLTATGADNYVWFNEAQDSLSMADMLTISLIESEQFAVIGTNEAGCTREITQAIEVISLPDVSIVSDQFIFCEGDTAVLNGTGANQYLWFDENSAEPMAEGELFLFFAQDNTIIRLVGANEFGCLNEASQEISVNPTPDVFIDATQTEICAGDTVVLTGNGADQYSWYDENSIAPIFEGEVFELALAESQNITLVGVNEFGCENEDLVAINVTPFPELSISLSGDTVCEGSMVQLTASGAETYLWFDKDNGLLPIADTPTLDWTATSSQTISLIGLNGECEATSDQAISVAPSPGMPDIAISGDTLTAILPDTSLTYQYQWYLNDTTISVDDGGTNPTYVISRSASYRLEIINGAGCAASSPSYDLILTGIDRLDVSALINIYPNPTKDKIRIQLPSSHLGNWKLSVHNAIGQEIQTLSQELKQQETTLDLSSLPRGAYFFYLMNDEARAFKKVVKQ